MPVGLNKKEWAEAESIEVELVRDTSAPNSGAPIKALTASWHGPRVPYQGKYDS